jgi:hypothetical protein
MRQEMRELVPSFDANRVQSLCSVLRSTMAYGAPKGKEVDWGLPSEELQELVLFIWAYALIWGAAGNLDTASQPVFDKWFRENLKEVPVGQEGSVYDFFLDFAESRCLALPLNYYIVIHQDNTTSLLKYH